MLPLRFSIGPISTTAIVGDIHLQISDDHRRLLYTGRPLPRQIPISYIKMPELSQDNIKITELNESESSIQVTENAASFRYKRISYDRTFRLPVRGADITDVAVRDHYGNATPLFFKDLIGTFNSPPQILDINLEPVPENTFAVVISAAEVAVFHNLKPKYDSKGRLEIYWMKYANSAGETVFRLLQSDPAFAVADIEDWDAQKRVYVTRPVGAAYRYDILFHSPGPFYIRVPRDKQIKLLKPDVIRPNSPWHLKLTTGSLLAETSEGMDSYSIPEYHFQNFSPIEPYKYSGIEECLVLDHRNVKAPFTNVLADDDHPVDVIVLDQQFNPKFGYSSKEEEGGRFWADRLGKWQEQALLHKIPLSRTRDAMISIHKASGVIHLPDAIDSTDRVFIKAHHTEAAYEYPLLNLNPLHNRALLSGKAVMYILPEAQIGPLGLAVHHFILDEFDTVVSYSDLRIDAEDLEPAEEETGYDMFKTLQPDALILGEVAISRESSISNLTIIDVRRPGGVLTKETEENILNLVDDYPELEWLSSNSLSGRPIPVQGALIVEAPLSLTEEAGGLLTRSDVSDLTTRHIALGYLPLVKYYADKPIIKDLSFVAADDTLTIRWTPVDNAESYRIYFGVDPKAMTSSEALIATADTVFENALQAEIEVDIDTARPLFLYLVPIMDGQEQVHSDIIRFSTEENATRMVLTVDAIIQSAPSLSVQIDAVIVNG